MREVISFHQTNPMLALQGVNFYAYTGHQDRLTLTVPSISIARLTIRCTTASACVRC